MAQKLPRPIEDYLIGKYDTGVFVYLITKEAYKTWFRYASSVKHLCIKNNDNLSMVQYSLSGNAKYKAYKLDKVPLDWMKLIHKEDPLLYEQLFAPKLGKFDHIKPDDYYVLDYDIASSIYLCEKKLYRGGGNSLEGYVIDKQYGNLYKKTATVAGLGDKNHKHYEYPNLPQKGKDLIKSIEPELYKHFEDFYAKQVAVKTEPTPDDYYIGFRAESGAGYFIPTREFISKDQKSIKVERWDGKESTTHAAKFYSYNTGGESKSWYKKFPQLSSEIKQELQKQNPERYKEWEDFYCEKYPNMQRLNTTGPQCGCGTCKDCLSRRPLPDPKDDYITVSYGELALVRRINYTRSKPIPLYSYNHGWVLKRIVCDSDTYPDEVIKSTWKNYEGIALIYSKFKQYYTELEQKKLGRDKLLTDLKIAEDSWSSPYWNIFRIKDPKDYIITSTQGGWGFMPLILFEDGYEQCRLWANPLQLVDIQYRDKLTLDTMLKATCLASNYSLSDVQKAMRKSNLVLYNIFSQVGSDSDIDDKAMTESYLDKIDRIAKEQWKESQSKVVDWMFNHPRIDSDVVRGKQAKFTIFEEAGPFPKFKYPSEYGQTNYMSAGVDPYQADFETQGSISIWGRDLHGKLVNRLSELNRGLSKYDQAWFRDQFRMTAADYYNQVMNDPNYYGVINIKPRRVGMSHFNQIVEEYRKAQELMKQFEQTGYLFTNNSPNTKTNNHEIINVPRKTITITGGQKCTGNSVSSIRCAPAVTEKHIGNRPESITGKESSRSCKIGQSI